MKYIDIHAHLNFPEFDADRQEVINRLSEQKMAVINIGTNMHTSKQVLELAQQYPNLYASVGIHPIEYDSIEDLDSVLNEMTEMAAHPKIVCIGECGLDFFHIEGDIREAKERQKKFFEGQIELSIKIGKPLMIHCRDAYDEVLEILKSYKVRTENKADELFGKKLFGNVHFFAGTLNQAKAFIDVNFTISFTGVVTFAPQYRELIEKVPIEKMHAETDSPFVAPVPFRGQRNEPLYTIEVIKKISEIKNMSMTDVAQQLCKNAQDLFGIDIA